MNELYCKACNKASIVCEHLEANMGNLRATLSEVEEERDDLKTFEECYTVLQRQYKEVLSKITELEKREVAAQEAFDLLQDKMNRMGNMYAAKVAEVEKRAEAAERVVMFARFLANENRQEMDSEEFIDCGMRLSEAIEKYDALKNRTETP